MFMQTLFWFIFLVNTTSVSQVCKILNNFPFRRILSFYEIEVFKFMHVAFYICLVGGVVIFDESWAGKGIDSRVNNVHGPVFRDAEVNSAMNLTYSEHRLGNIHGNTSGEPFEGSIFGLGDWSSWLISSGRCCFFSSMSKGSILSSGFCVADKRFFIGFIILNWWVLPLSLTICITLYVRTCYVQVGMLKYLRS